VDLVPGGTPQQKAQELRDALLAAGDWPHLVAIYDQIDGGPPNAFGYHVIGWAFFQFETNVVEVPDPGDPTGTIIERIELTGTFHKLFLDGSRLSVDGFGGSLNDFGVRAVGLAADQP